MDNSVGPAPVELMLNLPILFAEYSVNHRLPSGPAVMLYSALLGVETGNSVITPAVVIRPILLPVPSVNHRLPSGPAVMEFGPPPTVGIGNSVITPAGVILP